MLPPEKKILIRISFCAQFFYRKIKIFCIKLSVCALKWDLQDQQPVDFWNLPDFKLVVCKGSKSKRRVFVKNKVWWHNKLMFKYFPPRNCNWKYSRISIKPYIWSWRFFSIYKSKLRNPRKDTNFQNIPLARFGVLLFFSQVFFTFKPLFFLSEILFCFIHLSFYNFLRLILFCTFIGIDMLINCLVFSANFYMLSAWTSMYVFVKDMTVIYAVNFF